MHHWLLGVASGEDHTRRFGKTNWKTNLAFTQPKQNTPLQKNNFFPPAGGRN